MQAVFLKLLNMGVAAGWCILAVCALRLPLRRAPRGIVCALWALVGIRLACPFSIESAWSLIPSAETVSPGIVYAQTPAIQSGVPAVNSAVNPFLAGALAPDPAASVNPAQVWLFVASVLWAAGVAAMALYALGSCLRLRRRLREGVEAAPGVWLCDRVDTPFILGVVRPRVYLPSGLDGGQAALVLAHERAHLARRDHWWKPLGFLLLALHWYNPLVWLAYALFCRDLELACDERAVRGLDAAGRKAYSAALLACSAPGRAVSACPLAFGEVGVKARIKSVLRYRRPALWLVLAALAVCLGAAVCLLTDPAPEAEPFGRDYHMELAVYQPVTSSFAYVPGNAPLYRLTADGRLLAREDPSAADWAELGRFAPAALTAEGFDACFAADGLGWTAGYGAQALRRSVRSAWRLDAAGAEAGRVYLLLQTEDGCLFLARGYDAQAGGRAGGAIRSVFKLTETGGSPYAWTRGVAPGDVAAAAVTVWESGDSFEPDAAQLLRLTSALNAVPEEAVAPGRAGPQALSVLLNCGGREYLLRYANGVAELAFDSDTARLYATPEDGVWTIRDASLSAALEALAEAAGG